ncbi:NADH-quinone oxidoreductase subunit NuoN [Rhodococcus sp. CX]|uniref:NADH-quinone oxidoreductase subunit NuoN n=1 Tax=Rhodococcus sp. CX TaxID=2789880 RepID=UPI0027DD650F|nr:NADH-quinone oxidoreductase subunit NuoN [Rhodococcus sp. CX]
MNEISAPSIEYGLLSPMLIVLGVAVVGVLVEAFVPRRVRHTTQFVLAIAGLVAAFVAVVSLAGTSSSAVLGAVVIDGPALFLQGAILLASILAVGLIAQRRVAVAEAVGAETVTAGARFAVDDFAPQPAVPPGSAAERTAAGQGITTSEVFPLAMFAVGGMLLFPASDDLLSMFVALEVLSLPLYLLCGLARHRRLLSQEAALKYFLLGAFSSAFFLYGMAMLYGYAGTVRLSGIAAAVAGGSGDDTLALSGVALLAVGLLFKVGAVPFQSWIPDVYQGAPTSVTAFMASATKIAAFGALLRVFYVAVPELSANWQPVLGAVAVLTMVAASVIAVTQRDVKRMLAYSSVAHVGFVLTGLVAANHAGVASTMFYLLAYGISTVGAFAIVGLVRDRTGEAGDLSAWSGLGRRSPVAAAAFALFLLAFAGIPLTSGFVSKFAVFGAAIEGGAAPLVVVGVVCSAIAAYFYVRVIVLMFFTEPGDDAVTVVAPGAVTATVVAVSALVTIVLGIAPQPVLDLADRAAVFFQ